MPDYDVVVAGGGPAGSSVAWRAASKGARVLVLDKAVFPRDKPCGDGLTPRAVKWLTEMGLADELDRRFHRVDRVRLVMTKRVIERPWPARDYGFPEHGYVAARDELDELLLQHAARAGAEIRQRSEVVDPLVDDNGTYGLRYRTDGREHEVTASVVVGADGMSSRVGRALGMAPLASRPFAIAVRAQVDTACVDEPVLMVYPELHHDGHLVPGYGWVFPMGGGRLNIGVGYVSTYRDYRSIKINDVMRQFVARLPREWGVPSIEELKRARLLRGWRLPMGLAVWPPWTPGALVAGDAAGVVKPFTGVGISKALECGVLAADSALEAIDSKVGPADLSPYSRRLHETWGAHYRLGRGFLRVIGHPIGMKTFLWTGTHVAPVTDFLPRVLSNLYRERGGSAGDRMMRTAMRMAARGDSAGDGQQRARRTPDSARRHVQRPLVKSGDGSPRA